jgi:hypothetical protein
LLAAVSLYLSRELDWAPSRIAPTLHGDLNSGDRDSLREVKPIVLPDHTAASIAAKQITWLRGLECCNLDHFKRNPVAFSVI